MARKGTAKALKLLDQIEAEFGFNVVALASKGRSVDLLAAKAAFHTRAKALGIPVVAVAEVLGLTPVAVAYRTSPRMQETDKRNRDRRRSRIAKAWNVPEFHYSPREGFYGIGEVIV